MTTAPDDAFDVGAADMTQYAQDLHERNRHTYRNERGTVIDMLTRGQRPADEEVITPALAARRVEQGRAVIYLRVSTEEQAKVGGGAEGYSIPYQREACERKAREMGLLVVGTYVDPGKTATTVNRKDFKRMFAEMDGLGVTHVIVHKLDRLSRSPKADYFVDSGLERARASLVSVCEYIDDTPQGKLNLQIQRGVASYYSNNLATEVVKGLSTKVARGGTPHRAPHGYINKQRIENNADIRWVEVDDERAPHITWAFEAYATGEWTLIRLVEELKARGLTTRPTPKMPGRPFARASLHRILSNPYYIGIVVYKGVYHEGNHPPLVSTATWLRVQEVLDAHNRAGEKERRHPHYLKGSIACGRCGSRMIFSRNTGKTGKTYDYFFCIGTKRTTNRCTRPHVRVAAVEESIIEFYTTLRIPHDQITVIRDIVRAEIDTQQADAVTQARLAANALDTIDRERAKLLEAHYAGAVPLDMLKSEMARLTRAKSDAEQKVDATRQTVTQLRQRLDNALRLVEHCHTLYSKANAKHRRMLNQGFFRMIYVGEGGSIQSAVVHEPFAGLLAVDSNTRIVTETTAEDLLLTPTDDDDPTDTAFDPGHLTLTEAILRVDHSTPRYTAKPHVNNVRPLQQTRRVLAYAPSSNNDHLAEDRGFEPP